MYHDKRVLLIDIDPQCNLTFLCAIQPRWDAYKRQGGKTIVSLYERYLSGRGCNIDRALWHHPIEDIEGNSLTASLDLIPSDFELLIDQDVKVGTGKVSKTSPLAAQISEIKIRAEHYVIPRIFLKELLKQCQKDYDYILIDCPPNLYLLTQNALLASDYYIVTALPDHLSTIGMEYLIRGADQLCGQLGRYASILGIVVSRPRIGGIIFVRVLRQRLTQIHSETMGRTRHHYGRLVFEDYTTELTGYQEASVNALPVFSLRSSNAKRAADQYLAITNEFVTRFP